MRPQALCGWSVRHHRYRLLSLRNPEFDQLLVDVVFQSCSSIRSFSFLFAVEVTANLSIGEYFDKRCAVCGVPQPIVYHVEVADVGPTRSRDFAKPKALRALTCLHR